MHRHATPRDAALDDRPHDAVDERRIELSAAATHSDHSGQRSFRPSAPSGIECDSSAGDTAHGTAGWRVATASFDRRTALRAAGTGTLGAFALAATAACADDTVHDPDPLAVHELQARADAAAASAAIALAPQLQPVLTTIAAQRTEHAEVLAAEIARLVGVYGDGTTPVRKTRTPAATPAPVTAPGIDQLRDQLLRSQRATADTAVALSGYRAGLLASISAACAVHAEGLATA